MAWTHYEYNGINATSKMDNFQREADRESLIATAKENAKLNEADAETSSETTDPNWFKRLLHVFNSGNNEVNS
jgi:hypothetical protein